MAENITQVMMDEHQLILRMITLVEQNTAKVRDASFSNWNFFIDAVDFIRNYADRYHHAKEEDVLFVELVKNGMPEKDSPIEAMHMEHDQGRAFVKNIESAALKLNDGVKGWENTLAENAEGYAALLRGHIDKEDNILYPLAERVLPTEVRPRMKAAYQTADEQMSDAEVRYRTMVEKYETQVD